jgi:hypothetical protein
MTQQLGVVALVTSVIALWSPPASAQLCTGAASFRGAPLQAATGVGFSRSAREFGGAFSGGSDTLFAGGIILGENIDNTTGTGLTVSGRVGSDRTLDRDGNVHVCPIGAVSYTSGLKVAQFDASTVGFQAGGALGVVAAKTSTVDVVPTLSVSLEHDRLSVSSGSLSVTDAHTFGVASLGVGFVFGSRLSLVPSVSVPFGLDGGETQFLITLSYNFRLR